MNQLQPVTRRDFLVKALLASGQITLANSAVISTSLMFGSLAAGAKCAPENDTKITSTSAGPGGIRMYQKWMCKSGSWVVDGSYWCQIGGTPVTCP